MTNASPWPPPRPPTPAGPAQIDPAQIDPAPLFGDVILPPMHTMSPTDEAPWRLFLPTGLPLQPPLRDQLDAVVELTAAAVRGFAERFGVGPVAFPPVTLVSSGATRGDVPGVAVYMFSMIARDVSGDPFEGIRSIAHVHLDNAWNAAVKLDIEQALRELHTASVAIEGNSPMIADDAADLVVVGAHAVSLLHNLVGVIDKH